MEEESREGMEGVAVSTEVARTAEVAALAEVMVVAVEPVEEGEAVMVEEVKVGIGVALEKEVGGSKVERKEAEERVAAAMVVTAAVAERAEAKAVAAMEARRAAMEEVERKVRCLQQRASCDPCSCLP